MARWWSGERFSNTSGPRSFVGKFRCFRKGFFLTLAVQCGVIVLRLNRTVHYRAYGVGKKIAPHPTVIKNKMTLTRRDAVPPRG